MYGKTSWKVETYILLIACKWWRIWILVLGRQLLESVSVLVSQGNRKQEFSFVINFFFPCFCRGVSQPTKEFKLSFRKLARFIMFISSFLVLPAFYEASITSFVYALGSWNPVLLFNHTPHTIHKSVEENRRFDIMHAMQYQIFHTAGPRNACPWYYGRFLSVILSCFDFRPIHCEVYIQSSIYLNTAQKPTIPNNESPAF